LEKQEAECGCKIKCRNRYQAMASIASELIWIKQLLEDMKIICSKPMQMYYDNQAARHVASNPVFHERIKYIEVDCHFV
jgi:hypothetical protein